MYLRSFFLGVVLCFTACDQLPARTSIFYVLEQTNFRIGGKIFNT